MGRRDALLPVLLLAAAPLCGQPGVVSLTLDEAVQKARANSARLAQLHSLKDAADAGLRGARAGRLPQIDLQASYTRNSNVPELVVSIPGVFSQTVFPNIPDQLRTRAGLTLPVYTGGRVPGGIEAARAQTAAAESDIAAAQNDLTLETRTAYWALVAARESERVLGEAVTAYEAHARDAQNRERLGLAARNEVLRVQVERDRAELHRLQSRNSAAIANANLLRLLGLAPGTTLEPSESRGAPETAAPELEGLVARALESRPDAAALRSRVALADAAVKIARSVTQPQAGVQAGYDFARPNPRVLPLVPEWKGSWNVGVNLSWNVFDGGRGAAGVAQAEAQAQAARRQLEELERRVRLDVTSRSLELATARAAAVVAQRNVEAARENLRVAQDRYREGLIPSSERLDAATALLLAGLDDTNARVQLRVAEAQLDRAAAR
jgi:outer membrane protein TolC